MRHAVRLTAAILLATCASADIIPGDMNFDGDVDAFDRDALLTCMSGPDIPRPLPACGPASTDFDADCDIRDFAIQQQNITGCTAGCQAWPLPDAAGARRMLLVLVAGECVFARV